MKRKMDVSSDKLAKSHQRKPRQGQEKETLSLEHRLIETKRAII